MFISDKFIFDGIPSTDFNIYLISLEREIVKDMKIPFKMSISQQTSNKFNPFYKEQYGAPDEIVLTFAYMDENGIPIEFDDESFIRIKKWLITDYFASFIIEDYPDYKYYLRCVRIQDKLSYGNIGFIEVTFQPYTCYAYRDFQTTILSSNENISNISNDSIGEYCPIVEIINTGGNGNSIKINDLEMKNMKENEHIIIDNSFLTVFNSEGENRLSDCNRKWLKLDKGDNDIIVKGIGKVIIKAEFPIVL